MDNQRMNRSASPDAVAPGRKMKVMDILNLIAVIVLIIVLLYVHRGREGDLFGDEIPAWDGSV